MDEGCRAVDEEEEKGTNVSKGRREFSYLI